MKVDRLFAASLVVFGALFLTISSEETLYNFLRVVGAAVCFAIGVWFSKYPQNESKGRGDE